MNYVIFGGTFDPIHNGHIRIADAASKKLNATVIFVPSKSPRWKNPQETASQRLEMLNIALKNVNFEYLIDNFEIESKSEINYSIDTVRYFKSRYPNDNLYFLIGADQVNKFDDWKDAKDLCTLTKIVFVNRPNFELNKEIISKYEMLDLEYFESGDVSSSDIREMKSVDLPFEVLDYIERNRLYFMRKLATLIPEKRLNHSIEVANLTLKVAKTNNLNHLEKFYIAAILHDLGKAYSKDDETTLSIMNEQYEDELDLPSFAYHQFVGEYLARREFNIDDSEVLDAIKFHCTGKANMTQIGMIVYACDKIEPTREFDSTWLINACLKNWKDGFLETLKDNKKYLLSHKKDITNKYTDECFAMYLD